MSACNTLGDEFHVMLECPLYRDLRVKYIRKYYWNRTNMHKFIELFKSENSIVVKNVATYVQKSMEKRTFFYI